MKKESLMAAKAAYEIEYECIKNMLSYFDDDAFASAVDLLKNAERIGASGCGHSGIICQHFCHLMCCIEQPARFISPAEAQFLILFTPTFIFILFRSNRVEGA